MSFSGNPLSDNTGIVIANDDFFPDLDLDEFLRDYRLPGDYAEAMIQSHLALSMNEINGNLEEWRLDQEDAGHSALVDIPESRTNPTINGVSSLVQLYRRAVFCRAKALLLMQFATVTRRDSGENSALEAPESEDTFLSHSTKAQRRMMGLGDITAELI